MATPSKPLLFLLLVCQTILLKISLSACRSRFQILTAILSLGQEASSALLRFLSRSNNGGRSIVQRTTMLMICCGRETRVLHRASDNAGVRGVRWGLCESPIQGLQVVVFCLFSHVSENFQSVRAPSFFELDRSTNDLQAIYKRPCSQRRSIVDHI